MSDDTTMNDALNSQRHSQWFAVTAFSIIALVAMTTNFEGNITDESKEVKWAASTVTIALTFSALAVLAHVLLKEKFVGTVIEKGMVRRLPHKRWCSLSLFA